MGKTAPNGVFFPENTGEKNYAGSKHFKWVQYPTKRPRSLSGNEAFD
jgi:hypothetical protein